MKTIFKSAAATLALVVAGPQTAALANTNTADLTLTGAFDDLIATAKNQMMGDPQAALETASKAETLVSSLDGFPNREEALATVSWLKSEALLRTGDSAKAQEVVAKALGLAEAFGEESKLYGDILLARGRISKRNVDVQTAVESYTKAHDVFANLDENRGEAMSLYSMATIYREAENYEKALDYFQRANDEYQEDLSLSLSTFNSKGLLLQRLGKYDEARAQYERSLDLAEKMDSPILKARILTNLGELEVEAGNPDVGDQHADEAMRLLREAGDENWIRFAYGIKANAAFERGNMDEAQALIETAFDGVDIEHTNMSYMDMHQIAHDIYATRGDFGQSLEHFTSFKRLSDDAKKAASNANIALLGAKFHFAEQQVDIERLKTEKIQQDMMLSEAKHRDAIQMAVMTFGGLVVLFFFTAAVSFRNHRNRVAKVNDQLETTVDQLNEEIDRRKEVEEDLIVAKNKADEANRAKSTFLATMSHELRTPMNGILGFSNVLLQSELDEEQRDHLQIIESSGQSLLTLINDILDISQIEAGKFKLRPQPFDLPSMVDRAVKLLRAKAQEKRLDLAVHIDPELPRHVNGDGDRIRQILINLVGNAVKFTETGSVAVMVTKGTGENGVRIGVADTGIGIPADAVGELFQRFNQVDGSSTRNFGGTGLGLAISRELVEAMGGDIGVNSVFGEGSEFWIDVPMEPVEEDNVVHHANRRRFAEPVSVLVVDEVRINREVYAQMLPGMNVTPILAENADAALSALVERKANGETTDAIIVSERLSTATPEDFVRRVRQNALAPTARMILSTPVRVDEEELHSKGFDGVVDQPITESAVFAQLPQVLDGSEGAPADKPKGRVISLARPRFAGQVLVADDNEANRRLVGTLLQSMGVEVVIAENGAEAVELAAEKTFQMILMDLNMPVMNGQEAARRIRRAGGANEETPIVAFTADSFVSEDDERLAGMAGVLAKPIDVNQLTAFVRANVERRRTDAGLPGSERRHSQD